MTGADIEISSSFPFPTEFTDQLRVELPAGSEYLTVTSLFSMVVAGDASRLIRVVAIEDGYPYYGKLVVDRAPGHENDLLSAARQVWMDPDLAMQLNVSLGSTIAIGAVTFAVNGIIREDTSSSGTSFDLAPKVYMSAKYLHDTGLVQTGSRVRRELLVKLPRNVDMEQVEQKLASTNKDVNISIESHKNSSGQLGRSINYLNDFLGLSTLVAIFFAGLGGTYLYRDYLGRKVKDMAILMTCGATMSTIRKILMSQIVALALLGIAIAVLLGAVTVQFFPLLLQGLLPTGMVFTLQPRSLLTGAVTGLAVTLLFCVPMLSLRKNIRPQWLLQDTVPINFTFTRRVAFAFIPLVLFFYGLSIFLTRSVVVGSVFMGSFAVALVVLALVGWVFIRQVSVLAPKLILPLKLAILQLRRTPLTTVTSILALGLGVALVNLIPQLSNALREELVQSPTTRRPDLFLFDIQDEQINDLQKFLAERNLQLQYASPMVRARLTKINDQAIEKDNDSGLKTRESERRENFKSRAFNLSSRAELADSERLVEGAVFRGFYDWNSGKPVELSLEKRFASRLGLEVGDTMTFDIQGLEVKGRVINLRTVKWTSFQPNFFVVVQPGVLDDAPKTYIAAISAPNADLKLDLQTLIVKNFANISIVDVSKTITRILGVGEQMAAALLFMSYLALIAGLFVLITIFHHKVSQRVWDLALIKTLGMTTSALLRTVAVEMTILTIITQVIGSALAIGISLTIGHFVFDNLYGISWSSLLSINIAIFVLSMFIALAVSYRFIQIKPAVLLNDA